jgi:hypothetical protein
VDLSDTPGRARLLRQAIMPDVPDHPSPQTRTAVTARITAHVTQGWPHLLSVAPAEGDRVRRVFGGEDVFGARRSGWWVASG